MMSVEPVLSGVTCVGSFGVFLRVGLDVAVNRNECTRLDRVDVHRKHAGAVVCQQRGKGSSDHFRSTMGLSVSPTFHFVRTAHLLMTVMTLP